MAKTRRIVIKIGTSTLTGGGSRLLLPQVVNLVRQVSELIEKGDKVCVVSSGAIAVGRETLGFPSLAKSIPIKQMLAAVGQPRLMNVYEQLFEIFGFKIAQMLLTREDIRNRRRYINARNTLNSLLNHQVIPIINENDSVATEEIRIGDNDNLSALIANLIEADLLVLLTDQEGLLTANPDRSESAELIHRIDTEDIPEEIWEAAGGTKDGLGTGGMLTKLQAADTARRSGTHVVIAKGNLPNVLLRISSYEELGTQIYPTVDTLESRKRFLLTGADSHVSIIIDAGAKKALQVGGSLLPVGILDVKGNFNRGDIVSVRESNGKIYAIGLVNYSSEEVKKIKGWQSGEIESLLGFAFGNEVIHHNNMTVLR
ncbi:MAG: glutamate 5-kinase [Anaerolineaceae bacterium]|nr:glutamate 5-kinase [Anaerolineaceae bacterium]